MTSFCAAVNLVFAATLLFDVLSDGVTFGAAGVDAILLSFTADIYFTLPPFLYGRTVYTYFVLAFKPVSVYEVRFLATSATRTHFPAAGLL